MVAPVDIAEQAEEVPPDGLRLELVHHFQRAVEQAVAHEIEPLGEGDEENAVEDFLRRLDRRAERELRTVGGMLEKGDQPFPQAVIFLVQPVGDVPVGGVSVAQEPLGRIAEKALGAQNQAQAVKLSRIVEPSEVEALKGLPPAPIAVEPDLGAVRHQHPFGARRIVGVFPRLLHRSLGASGHDPVEVPGVGAFQFERRGDRPFASGLEIPERGVD